MGGHDPDVLSALLEEAAALPLHARPAFVDRVCNGDDDLRETLTSLLVAHDAASGYFERIAEQIIDPALMAFANDIADELLIGQSVAQYRLLERLGSGGMGVVFKAHDVRLDRFVALKFLPAHLSADPHAKDRLVAEAKAASALDHPNIAVVHDIAETDGGRLFIVMAYYKGETLALKNEHASLSSADALDVVTQIADALSAAHQKGIIHRDVKPSNVLVTPEGIAKLLDFGIATVAEANVAREAAIPGTVAYMSPEQTRGSAIDRRTDLWSLGVLLYEMLTGVRPFRAESYEDLVSAIRRDEWQPLNRKAAGLPRGVSRILERCLAKDPDRRYTDAQEMLVDLRALALPESRSSKSHFDRRGHSRLLRYGIVAAIVIVTAVGGIYMARRSAETAQTQPTTGLQSHRSRLAVLPIVTIGSDPDDSYLADGLTDELIARLSRIGGLRVIARSSVMPYINTAKSPNEVGRELDVGALLTGSVRQATGRLEVTLRLVDARSGETLWFKDYAATVGDLQSMQRDVVLRVTDALGMKPQGAQIATSARGGTANADAYLLHLKGQRFLEKRNVEAVTRAREYFEQALDLDPSFAKAWVGLGEAFSSLTALAAVRTADAYARSRAAAQRALDIDPDLAEAHVCLATALSQYYWDLEGAASHYRRALELNSGYADAHRLYAEHLRFEGRFDEALREARTAETLDPLSPAPQIVAGTILYWARRYDESMAEFRRILEVNPRFSYAYFFLALTHIQKQEYREALDALSVSGAGSNLQRDMLRGYIYGIVGRRAEARQAVERLRRLTETENISQWHPAIVYIALGEHDRAIDLLEQAYKARDWQLRMLMVEPLLDPLRSHPRFRALALKMQSRTHQDPS
jgi:eukaryotic-like serine/threonine-protein kinase